MISISFRCAMCLLVLVCSASKHAVAQATLPDYGYQWSTITHPGNRMPNEVEAPQMFRAPPGHPINPRGRVDHVYRIAQTNVTNDEYARFLTAYQPFMRPSDFINSDVTGFWIDYNRSSRTFQTNTPGYGRVPAESVTWLMMARYANWLNNGETLTRDAFEYGAYDLRSLGGISGGWSHAPVRLPDAKVWIPSFDELIKATYYDPNRYGPGQEGYWVYPHGSDTQPIYNYPELGGESDAHVPFDVWDGRRLPVDAYPNGRTPWGLYGMSGGVVEFSDTLVPPTPNYNLWGVVEFYSGSGRGHASSNNDRIDYVWSAAGAYQIGVGFRIAGAVPAPGSVCVLVGTAVCLFTQRRRSRS